jgi:hypothetical protein
LKDFSGSERDSIFLKDGISSFCYMALFQNFAFSSSVGILQVSSFTKPSVTVLAIML